MLPFLKLTASLPLKINGWKMSFLLGPIFGGYVSFREGISLQNSSYLIHIISDRFISNFPKSFLWIWKDHQRRTPFRSGWPAASRFSGMGMRMSRKIQQCQVDVIGVEFEGFPSNWKSSRQMMSLEKNRVPTSMT